MKKNEAYLKNQKDPGGSKHRCAQDEEDFKQEQLIKQWLSANPGTVPEFDFKHISRKGTARNTLDQRSIRLDQKVFDDSSGTYADIIAGSDGRDLEGGGSIDEDERDPREKISWYLSILGFNQGEIKCLINQLNEIIKMPRVPRRVGISRLNRTLKKQLRLGKYLIDSESLIPLKLYKE